MNNNEILTKEDAICALREYICDEMRKQKEYRIKIATGSGVPKRYLKQYYPSWAHSEFCINVVNGNFSFSLEMFTYPDCVGRYDSEYHSFTAEEFHEIAIECNFPKMYEFMESEEDWKQIDNDEFREALAELEEYFKSRN